MVKYSDIVQPDSSVTDLATQLRNAANAYSELSSFVKKDAEQVAQSLGKMTTATASERSELMRVLQEVEKLKARQDALDATYKKTVQTLTAKERAQKRLAQAQSNEGKEVAKLNEQVRQQNQLNRTAAREALATGNSIEALRAKVAQATVTWLQAERGTREFAIAQRELTKTTRELRKEEVKVDIHRRGVGDYAGGAVKGLLRLGGAYLTVGAAVGVLKNATKTITDFEQANAVLASILGVTRDKITALTESAKLLGATTEWSASQVTELQTELAKLGYGESEIISMQKPILNLATALRADLGPAAELTGSVLKAMGLQARDTEKVVGALVVGANKTALDFGDFQTSLSDVLPVARRFGFELEDVIALLGNLADSGFDASSAGTATRNILLNLADSSGKLAKSLGRPVKGLDDLVEGMIELRGKGVDLATTLELTDKRSVAAFNTFLDGAESIRTLRGELNDTAGVVEATVNEQLNTVQGSVKMLNSAWESLMLSFSNSTGFMKKAVDGLTSVVNGITKIISPTKTTVETLRSQVDVYVDLEAEVTGLVNRYKELKNQTTLTDGEQKELTDTMNKLANIVPGIVTRFDQYGNILDINTGKAYAFMEAQKAIMKNENKEVIKNYTKELEGYEKRLKKLRFDYEQGGTPVLVGMDRRGNPQYQRDEGTLPAIAKEIQDVQQKIANTSAIIEELDGTTWERMMENRKEFLQYQKDFNTMTQEELDAWIKDVANKESKYIELATQIYNVRFPKPDTGNDSDLSDKEITALKKAQDEKLKLQRQVIDSENALIEDGFEKTNLLRQEQQRRAIEDLEVERDFKLKYQGLSAADYKNYNRVIENLRKQHVKENEKAEATQQTSLLATRKQTLELELGAMDENHAGYLAKKNELWEVERQQELAANKALSEELRQDETKINAKWDKYILDQNRTHSEKIKAQQLDNAKALYESELELTVKNEKKKEALKLFYEADYWEKRLALMRENMDKYSAEEIAAMENHIAKLRKDATKLMKEGKSDSFLHLLGIDLDSDQEAALNSAYDHAIERLNEWADARVAASEKVTEAAQREVDQAYKNLEIQTQLMEKGYANRVATAQKELEDAKRREADALAHQEQVQKAQERLQAAQQAGSLITAAAGIWQSFGSLGPWGIAAAIVATGIMFGSFAAAKIQARKAASETFGDGGQGVIGGGTHASGNDTFIGSAPSGKQRRAERGERWAIFSSQVTRQGGKALEHHLEDIQRHGYTERFLDNTRIMSDLNINVGDGGHGRQMRDDIAAIRKQGETQESEIRTTADGKYRIERYKNLTRYIKIKAT